MLDRIAMMFAFGGIFAALAASGAGGSGLFKSSPYLVSAGLLLLGAAAQFGLSKSEGLYDKCRRFLLPLGLFVSSLGLIGGILTLIFGSGRGGLSLELIFIFLAAVILFIVFLLAYLEARHEFVE